MFGIVVHAWKIDFVKSRVYDLTWAYLMPYGYAWLLVMCYEKL